MKTDSKLYKIGEIFTPIILYITISSLATSALSFVFLALDIESALLAQMISSVVVFPFLYRCYRQDGIRIGSVSEKKIYVIIFLFGGCFSVAWNNILGMINIAKYSATYTQVEEAFYTGELILEMVALCIVIPILEEVLYRGIIYGRIRRWLGTKKAIFWSAVIFGLVHMNLVQFIYATVFGLFLAWFVEVTDNLTGAVLAHIAANLISVLRAETGFLSELEGHMGSLMIITVVLLLVSGVFVVLLAREFMKKE